MNGQSLPSAGLRSRVRAGLPAATTLVLQGLSSLANLAITWALVRQLGLAGFGYYAVYFLIAVNVSTVALALIVQPLNSVASQLSQRRQEEFIQSARIGVGLIICVILVLGALAWAIALAFSQAAGSVAATVIYSAAMALGEFHRRVLFFRRMQSAVLLYDLLRYSLVGAAVIGVMHFMPDASAAEYAIAIAATFPVALLSTLLRSGSTVSPAFDRARTAAQLRRLGRSGGWLAGAAVLRFLALHLVILLSAFLLSPASVGLIRLSQTIVGIVNPAMQAMEHLIPAYIGRRIKASGKDKGLAVLRRIAVATLCGFAAIFLGLALLSPLILPLMNVEPDPRIQMLVAGFGVHFLIQVCVNLIGYTFRVSENTRAISSALLISAISGVALAYPLLLLFDVYGVVICIILGQLAACWRLIASLRRKGR